MGRERYVERLSKNKCKRYGRNKQIDEETRVERYKRERRKLQPEKKKEGSPS